MISDLIQRHFGRVIKGELKFYKPESFAQILKQLEGKEFELTIMPKREEHSVEQRGYIHALCRWLVAQTEIFGGWEEDEVYRFIMERFGGSYHVVSRVLQNKQKEKVRVTMTRSIKDMSKKEVSELIEKLLQWLAEQGVYPPSAEEARWSKYSKKSR